MHKLAERAINTLRSDVALLCSMVVVVSSVALAVYFKVESIIDERIDQRLAAPEYLRKVASLVRPYVIFDQDGAVRFDGGALEFLEKPPEVIQEPVSGSTVITSKVSKIIVTPKKQMLRGPLLQVFDGVETHLDPKLGPGLQLIYEIWGAGLNEKRKEILFRIEILN